MFAEEFQSREELNGILDKALRYPSGDNCQPFRFSWHEAELTIIHLEDVAKHMMNPKNQASLISLGMLLESLKISSSSRGYDCKFKLGPEDQGAKVSFIKNESIRADNLEAFLETRFTDRRPFLKEKKGKEVEEELKKIANKFQNVELKLIRPDMEYVKFAQKVDHIFWKEKGFLKDVMGWVRFRESEIQKTKNGMPWRSLGISWAESIVLRVILKLPNWLMNSVSIVPSLGNRFKLKELILSSDYIMGIVVKENTPELLVEMGRLGLRAWVSLNKWGHGAQPLSTTSLALYQWSHGDLKMGNGKSDSKKLKKEYDFFKKTFSLRDEACWAFRIGLAEKNLQKNYTLRYQLKDHFL